MLTVHVAWASLAPTRRGRGRMAYTCTGGDFATGNLTSIPSGIYASITVKGASAVAPDAVIRVLGEVNVATGGVLDAQSAPSTIRVGRDVTAGPGSLLGLGCLPNPAGHTTTVSTATTKTIPAAQVHRSHAGAVWVAVTNGIPNHARPV
jgi:hypothetical protein